MALAGCGGDRLPTAPVEGKILLGGKALEFGEVVFYPERGPPGRGNIGSDGTFHLSTYGHNDGAVVGKHRVEIKCYEKQRPGFTRQKPIDGEEPDPFGKSLIPLKYASATSSLRAEVRPQDNEPFVFDLK
jgi:hypothetical protein